MNKRNLSLLFSVSTILTVFIALPVSAEKTAGGTDADRRSTDVNICSIAGMNKIELEASEKDLVINTTSDGYGRIAVSISSESRELSDIQMFVSTFDGDLMTNTAKASAVISGSTATFTATLPLTNGRIFIWDGKQRPLANAAAIE